MILFLLIKNGNCTQIVYSNFFEHQMINDWKLTNKNTFIVVQDALCGSSHYLLFDNQATQYNVLLHKSFGLGTHNEVIIEFKLWKIDNWINNFFIIYIDNEIILDEPYSCSGSATNICGDSMQNDEVTIISKSMQHDRPSIQIIILAQNGEWGISEFFLMIEESNNFSDFISFNNQRLILQSFTSINIQEVTIQEQWNYSASDLIDHCHGKLISKIDLYYHKSQGSLFEKQISLEDHVAITLKLKIMIFNSDATTITLKIDDTIVQEWQYSSKWINYGHTDINFDGFWYHYTQTNVNISNYAHTQHQIKITILTVMTSVYTPWAPWFGIRDFQLYLLLPKLNYICKDQNIYAFDGCFSFIYDCVQGCMNCVNGICINCFIGWQYIDINKICIPICGDLILTSQEECDDGNQIPYDGCHNCRFSCPLNCDVCQFGQCLQQSNSNQYQLSNVLLDCQANIILQNNQCINACYDLVMDGDFKNFGCYLQGKSVMETLYQIVFIESLTIQKFHQTFEQYLIQKYTQGNLNQIYQCKQNDLEICLECEIGFILSINHRYCIPICGDGVVQIYEICDDQNTLQLDGCYKCQQSCQLSCLNCINGECLICLDGWQLINKICQQICGDGLLAIQSYEQCDDNNQIDGDGCFQCLFECAPYCLSCIDQYHCQNCIDHFELVQNECRPICGDLYQVEGLEDCDDGNQISNDGCYNCQFQCEIDCTTCINGKCKEYIKKEEPKNNQTEPTIEQLDQICNEGCLLCLEDKCQLCENFSTLQDGQCIKCGNGYKSEDEFCDDGNTLNNDGCSNNCNIESGWDCNIQNYQLSQCYKIAQLTLNFLNQSYDTQYISLTYTKKVKLIESNQLFFDQTMLFIESLESNYYNLTVEPVTEIFYESVRDINYIIAITFLKKIQQKPKLTVSISAILLDENEILVPPSCSSITLRLPQVMDQFQMQSTNRIQGFGQGFMMGLTGLGVVFLILGQITKFLEILDILQYQSFLKFINVEYPQNLQIYFQSSDFVQLNSILVNFRIVQIFNLIIYQEDLKSKEKFNEYQLNADLLNNIYGCVVEIILIFLGYLLIMFYIFSSKTNCFTARYFYNVRILKSQIVNYIAIKIYYLHRKIHKLSQIKLSQQLIIMFYTNSFDLIFKMLLFLYCDPQINLRSLISFAICVGFFIIMIKSLINPFQRGSKTVVMKDIKEQLLESITLCKKFLFLLILIRTQVQPLLQCILLSFCQLLFIEIIWFFQLANSKFQLILFCLNEIPIMLFTFINQAFCSDFSKYFPQDMKLLIGFFQIGLLIISMFGPIIKLIKQIYNSVKKYLNERKEKMKQIQIHNLYCFETVRN